MFAPGNTAWPDALPTVHDHAHAIDCAACQASDATEYIECGVCGESGPALIVDVAPSIATAHCPHCGAEHRLANEPDRD